MTAKQLLNKKLRTKIIGNAATYKLEIDPSRGIDV